VANRDDEPERGVHRIILRSGALVGKPVWQHPFGNVVRPLQKYIPGQLQLIRGDTKSPDRNESISSPIPKPRVTSNYAFTGSATNKVRFRRTLDRIGLLYSAFSLISSQLVNTPFQLARARFGKTSSLDS